MNQLFRGIGAVLIAVILIAAGVFDLVLGIGQTQKIKAGKYVETEATVTKIETTEVADDDAPGGTRTEYRITAEYTANGRKVVALLRETPKEFYEGMKLAVCYNTDDPADNILPGSKGGIIMIGLGVVAVLAGVFLIFRKLTGR